MLEPSQRPKARWDFFICHASEDKAAVAQPLYDELVSRGHTVWLDVAELTLGDSLRQSIDRGLANCRFGIVILSPAFFKKNWPQYELDGLIDRQMSGVKTVLPIWHRVDHDDVAAHSPPLAGRLAATTAWGISPVVDQIVRAFTTASNQASIAGSDELSTGGRLSWSERLHFPLSDAGRAQLLRERPDCWEYFLFADSISRGMAEHEPAWRDHQLRLVRSTGRFVTKDDVGSHITQACQNLVGIVGNVERLLGSTATQAAFGAPGEPGDPEAIQHLCQRVTALYGHLLEWAAEVRSTRAPDDFDKLFELVAAMADQPIREFREFSVRCTDELAKLPELVSRKGDKPVEITLALTLTADANVQRAYEKELKRLRRRRILQ